LITQRERAKDSDDNDDDANRGGAEEPLPFPTPLVVSPNHIKYNSCRSTENEEMAHDYSISSLAYAAVRRLID